MSDKPKTYTVVWRIQAEGRTPEEALKEAYETFKDPGEALMFEVYEGIEMPEPGTCKFIDLFFNPEEVEPDILTEEERAAADRCQSCVKLGTVLCVGDTGGYGCYVPHEYLK